MTSAGLILLAEDEETEAMIFKIAMRKAGLNNPLVLARDGLMAVDYLEGNPPYKDRVDHPLPSLVVLDLKMPRLSGFDVLEWLSKRPEMSEIPAVVLSSSAYPEDIHKALELGARDYKVKPHTIDELGLILKDFAARWLSNAEMAPSTRG